VPSVNPIQAPEPRPQASNKQQVPSGDPFADMLESAANERPARERARAERSQKHEQPTAPASRGKTRADALERGDQPTGEIDDAPRAKEKSAEEPATDTAEAGGAAGSDEVSDAETNPQANETVAETLTAAPATEVNAQVTAAAEKPATEATTDGGESVALSPVFAGDEGDAALPTTEAAKSSAPAAGAVPGVAKADQGSEEAPLVAAPKVAAAPQAPADDALADATQTASTGSNMRSAASVTGHEQAQQTTPANQHAASFAEALDADAAGPVQQTASQQGASQVQAKAPEMAGARPTETSTAATAPVDPAAPKVQPNPAQTAPMPDPVRALNASFDSAILNAANANDSKPVPLSASTIAVEIVSRMREGMRRFDIRLDPPELGRIDVRLEVDRNGNVSTKLTVDRPETLDLMQRDARALERALQQSGLKTDAGGLEFSLRQHADERFAQGQGNHGRGDVPAERGVLDGGDPLDTVVQGYYRAAAYARGGVDITV